MRANDHVCEARPVQGDAGSTAPTPSLPSARSRHIFIPVGNCNRSSLPLEGGSHGTTCAVGCPTTARGNAHLDAHPVTVTKAFLRAHDFLDRQHVPTVAR